MSTDTLVIVHGKSEEILCQSVSRMLRMPMVVFSRNEASEAITIEQLPSILTEDPFTSKKALHRRFEDLEYNGRRDDPMKDLRIFTIMDVDMDRRSLKSYISGDLFRNAPLRQHLVPIYSDPNLDNVLQSVGVEIDTSRKTKSYARAFERLDDPLDLYMRLRSCPSTNLDVFLRHCLSCSPPYQDRIPAIR